MKRSRCTKCGCCVTRKHHRVLCTVWKRDKRRLRARQLLIELFESHTLTAKTLVAFIDTIDARL